MPTNDKQSRIIGVLIPGLILLVIAGAVALTVGLGNPLGQAIGRNPWVVEESCGRVTVASTVDEARNAEVARWADGYLDGLEGLLGIEAGAVRLNLFRDRQEYREYCEAYVPGFEPGMQFCYSRPNRAVYGYRCALFRIKPLLRHEIFHAVAHVEASDIALWLEEGIAEYMEDCELRDGVLVHDGVQGGWLRLAYRVRGDPARNPGLLPRVGERRFYARRGKVWYALAYSTTLYLAKSGRLAEAISGEEVVVDPVGYRYYIASGDWDEDVSTGIRGGAEVPADAWRLATRGR